jgi:hypothetical protein
MVHSQFFQTLRLLSLNEGGMTVYVLRHMGIPDSNLCLHLVASPLFPCPHARVTRFIALGILPLPHLRAEAPWSH